MAVPPYKFWAKAYAGSGDSEAGPVVSTPPDYTLQQPQNVTIALVGGLYLVGWEYTPGAEDGATGFKVYVGKNPTPDWGSAYDNGLAGGDGGSPTQTFEALQYFGAFDKFVFCVVQVYDGDGNTMESVRVYMEIPAGRPEELYITGIYTECLEAATTLTSSAIGDPDPWLKNGGVYVPSVSDIVAGSGITVTPIGKGVSIAAGGGGGGGNISGAYDIENASFTPLSLTDECEGGSLNANWTPISGTSGTVDLLGTTSGVLYDRTTRTKGMLVQTNNNASLTSSSLILRAPAIAANEQILFSLSLSNAPSSATNVYIAQVEVSNNATLFSGTRGVIYINNSLESHVVFYDGVSNTRSPNTGRFGSRVYFRIIRIGNQFSYFYSNDGTIWCPIGSITDASMAYTWLLLGSTNFTRVSTGDPIACINWIRHCAYTGYDPW